ncbi:hypothetical protein EJA70_20760 [Pseudomonas sp. PB103]|jgi:Flp pilus assembly protein TadB|uniref:hypothetical protein n=1 Tax=Pseudomonas sp. PB103 TaxID=2494698 RepID=UPI00131C933D|nr:hypothetical protein [Pseudomonas sp. PB103]KAE9641918.1 hypothetical protein EJA70_20760 [Pseudomonas sp. PB103]
MNAISREEFNARIETIETRMDARLDAVSAKIDGFLSVQAGRDKTQAERENTRTERENTQVEREKTQTERDKRYDLIAQEMHELARGAQEAARQGATVKANVWAATAVQLLGIVAIVVGSYYANQANMYVAIQSTLTAIQAGKEFSVPTPFMLPVPTPPQ